MKKKIILMIICFFIFTSFLSGCTNQDIITTPIITEFTANPNKIYYGNTSNLEWTVQNAENVSIDNEIGTVSLEGNRIIQPSITTTYILTASKSGKTITASTTIIVELTSTNAPSLQFIKDAVQMTLTVTQADSGNILWTDFKVINSTGTYAVTIFGIISKYVTAGDTLTFTDTDTYKIRYTPTNTLISQWTFGRDTTTTPSIQFVKDSYLLTLTVTQIEPTGTNWGDFRVINSTGTYYPEQFNAQLENAVIYAGDTLTFTDPDTYKIRYVPTNTLIGQWTYGNDITTTPSLQFVKDASQMTLTVAQADTGNILWANFEIVNSTGNYKVLVFNAALTGYVKAGDTLTFTDADTYKIRYTPTNTLMGEWTFIKVVTNPPSIQFVKDASQMTLTVAQISPTGVKWGDFQIVNSTGTYYSEHFNANLDNTIVYAGDTLSFTDPDTYKIRYVPTNTLIGEWTFA